MEKQNKKKLLWVLIPLLVVLVLCAVLLLMRPDTVYTVSFCDTDGTVLESDRYAEGAELKLPEDPQKEGYQFGGWILEGEEKPYDFSAEDARKVQSDMKFTASFGVREYVVEFLDANGVSVISSSAYRYGEEFTVPADPEKEGHSFVGWMRKGDSGIYDFTAKDAKNAKDGMIFLAKFEANKHKVVFMDAEGKEYKTFTLRYGDNFVVPDTIEREGYEFDGWALEGEKEAYDFEATNGTKVGDKDYTFVPLYTKLCRVMGRMVRLDGSEYSGKVTLCFGKTEKTVTIDSGWFTVDLRPGYYPFIIKLTGYRCLPEEVTLKGEFKDMGDITLIQALKKDFAWWDGATMTEEGRSATISTSSKAHKESATEYRLGNNVTGATSWNIKSHIEAGATGRVGFSFGRNDAKNGTVYFYVDMNDGTAGFFTWATNKETGLNANKYSQALSDTVLEALKSADGYDLELKASNINGEGTGWLTLYVNNTEVLRVYNNFVGVSSGGKGVTGQVMDLGNVHLSLAVMGTDAKAVFTDYMHQKNGVRAVKEVPVTGKLEKVDKTALAEKVTLQCGSICRIVDVAEDGSFSAMVPAGNYNAMVVMDGYWGSCGDIKVGSTGYNAGTIVLLQNLVKDIAWFEGATLTKEPAQAVLSTPAGANAEAATEYKILPNISDAQSWRVEAQIQSGATGKVGYSVGRNDGNNGTVVFYVDKDAGTYGFFTWATNQYTGATEMFSDVHAKGYKASGLLTQEVKNAMASGYKLTLTATNIDGEGTGWLTLCVNDTAVLTMDASEFTGVLNGGKGVSGQKMNLSTGHVSLVVIGKEAKAAFKNYYTVLNAETDLQFGTVTGTCVKVDGTAGFPATLTLRSGTIYQEVAVAADGTFSAKLPIGTYTATGAVSGYRVASDDFAVTSGQNANVTVKLLQNLTKDFSWWAGATKTESGASVTMTTTSSAHKESATEYKLGSDISGATSWRISAHIEPGSTGNIGFSVGSQGTDNGNVFLYVNKGTGSVGYFTLGTYLYTGTLTEGGTLINGVNKGSYVASDAVKTALNSADGYDLALTATNIDGEGTGWLTLYVNDEVVMTMYNSFVGKRDGKNGKDGHLIDLGDVHLSLVAQGTGVKATFTDYYYKQNGETAKAAGMVNGKLVKLDGTALPTTVLLKFGNEYRKVNVINGTFKAQLPAGTYAVTGEVSGYRVASDSVNITNGQSTDVTVKLLQNLTLDWKWWNDATKTESGSSVIITTISSAHKESGREFKIGSDITAANSWKVSAHIEPGSTGNIGFTVGSQGAKNGTVFLYVNKDTGAAGFYTVGTFNYYGTLTEGGAFIDGKNNGSYTVSDTVKALLNSANGYDLTLTATNIDGASAGWLTLYVNDTAVLTMYNNFIGRKDNNSVENHLIDLSKVHLSLAAQGTGIKATFTDYYTRLNTETDKVAGTVNGKLVKLDGTALPTTAVLQFGNEYRRITFASDGSFKTQLPAGTYSFNYTLEGYRTVCSDFTVTAGGTTNVTAKFLQNLTLDWKWWNDATKTESGSSVIITTISSAHKESGREFKIGSDITAANSWKVSAHIEPGSTGNIGFTVGSQGAKNGTVFLYVNKDTGATGFYTVGTFNYYGTLTEGGAFFEGKNNGSYTVSDTVKALLNSANGYDLTLTATNIDGASTGWLTLYVNDTAVLTMYNNFIGRKDNNSVENHLIDLSKVHLSLAAQGTGIKATFTDYYYKLNSEAAREAGTVNGKLVKLDGTALPTTAVLQFGSEYRRITFASDGSFKTQLPAGTYSFNYTLDGYKTVCSDFTVTAGGTTNVTVKFLQNLTADFVWNGGATKTENGASATIKTAAKADSMTEYKIGGNITAATSWTAEAYIEPGATGFVGFTFGGNTESKRMIMVGIDHGDKQIKWRTWGNYNITAQCSYVGGEGNVTKTNNAFFKIPDSLQSALTSGYKLTLKVTDIQSNGTCTMTLYINDTECARLTNMQNNIGGGTALMNLADVHVSLMVMGNNVGATFTNYYLKVN